MRHLIPALVLALGACQAAPENRPIAGAVNGQKTSTDQSKKLDEMNVRPDDRRGPVTGADGKVVDDAPTNKPPEIDATRRFEYAEVTVDVGDPVGMRALVPYLLKPETWTLVKCEMVSTTSKYYKFQKVTSNDGRSLPDVDVFKTRR